MTITATTRTRKSTTKAVAAKPAPTYVIHSLDEFEIDTRTTRTPALTAEQARNLTTEIQRTTARLWLLVTEAHDRKAHLALGYETWADYCKAELNISESRSYQFLDTGHVMKVLAAAGVDVESYSPPPTRVIARVKDRLTDVRKAVTAALQEGDGDDKAVDKAIRALAREPRPAKARNGNGASSAAGGGEKITAPAAKATTAPKANGEVPCPACAGTGKVSKRVADRLLEVLQSLK